jgi:hypothetical protein
MILSKKRYYVKYKNNFTLANGEFQRNSIGILIRPLSTRMLKQYKLYPVAVVISILGMVEI